MNGGYDEGYEKCDCFWGMDPGRLVKMFFSIANGVEGLRVLDVGCGEGKNAAYFAKHGATVRAIDISTIAMQHARRAFGDTPGVSWELADVRELSLEQSAYQVVIAYGFLHCLHGGAQVKSTVEKLKSATAVGGYHLICAFNSRYQELQAHSGFKPTLLGHEELMDCYHDWEILYESDEDLTEKHPHNSILHTHSMTRMIVRKKA
jgi:tellurite methyltransferase